MSKKLKKKTKTGNRHNKGKTRWRNFPLFLLEPLMELATQGEHKYGTYNFLDGMYMNDSLDSLKRHLVKFEDPNKPDLDEETGCSHLIAVAWNALVADYNRRTRPDLDDRYRGPKKRKKK